MPIDYRTRLESGLLLGDGAMGAEVYARGFSFEGSLEYVNLTDPDIVQAIHRLYLGAGADLIESNTFAANRIRQEEFGLEEQAAAMVEAGVRMALEACMEAGQEEVLVGTAIGPLGK